MKLCEFKVAFLSFYPQICGAVQTHSVYLYEQLQTNAHEIYGQKRRHTWYDANLSVSCRRGDEDCWPGGTFHLQGAVEHKNTPPVFSQRQNYDSHNQLGY